MRNDFHLEVQRLFVIFILCAIVGFVTSYFIVAFLVGCVVYIFWTLFQLRQLEHWLVRSKRTSVPDASGVWGNIFDHLSREKKRRTKDKKRLKLVMSRIDAMTGTINDALILLDKDLSISWLNKASGHLLGLKKTDVGNQISNFIRSPAFVQHLNKKNQDLPLVLPGILNKDQRLEFRLNQFGRGENLLIVRDVTRLYKLEQVRKDFVANVSHELRTPLTVISGYLETLNDSQDLNSHWKKPMMQMQQQSLRMTTLINDLTMLSKLETDNIDKKQTLVHLQPLLRMIVEEAKTVSGNNNHNIYLDCNDNFTIMGNDRELHSAFSNLIMNAVKYSPPGKDINVRVEKNKNELHVHVQDNGIGIEQHHIARLTERFYRVDASRSIETGGTGLGLAIVKHILARHNASLEIDSRLNKGSTFTAIFPYQPL